MPDPIERKTMTIAEAAAYLGIGRNTAYELANQIPPALPVLRLGGRILVIRSGIERMLEQSDQMPRGEGR